MVFPSLVGNDLYPFTVLTPQGFPARSGMRDKANSRESGVVRTENAETCEACTSISIADILPFQGNQDVVVHQRKF